jgi:hypothetical protein
MIRYTATLDELLSTPTPTTKTYNTRSAAKKIWLPLVFHILFIPFILICNPY